MENKVEYLSDEAAYAAERTAENVCGLVGFSCETWAETNGGGGTCRDSWLESEHFVALDEVLKSDSLNICGQFFLVCVKDGVAYVRRGAAGGALEHIDANNDARALLYATYGAELHLTVKAVYE